MGDREQLFTMAVVRSRSWIQIRLEPLELDEQGFRQRRQASRSVLDITRLSPSSGAKWYGHPPLGLYAVKVPVSELLEKMMERVNTKCRIIYPSSRSLAIP